MKDVKYNFTDTWGNTHVILKSDIIEVYENWFDVTVIVLRSGKKIKTHYPVRLFI